MDARAAAAPRNVTRSPKATPTGAGCRIGPRNATSPKEPVIPAARRRTKTPASQTAEKAPVHLRFCLGRTFAARYATYAAQGDEDGCEDGEVSEVHSPTPRVASAMRMTRVIPKRRRFQFTSLPSPHMALRPVS